MTGPVQDELRTFATWLREALDEYVDDGSGRTHRIVVEADFREGGSGRFRFRIHAPQEGAPAPPRMLFYYPLPFIEIPVADEPGHTRCSFTTEGDVLLTVPDTWPKSRRDAFQAATEVIATVLTAPRTTG